MIASGAGAGARRTGVIFDKLDSRPRQPRVIAFGLAVLLHVAMLALLLAWEAPRELPREEPPLMVTFEAQDQAAGGAAPSSPSEPPETPAPDLPPVALPLPPELQVEPPPPFTIEPIDFPEMTPQFDAEPDPAVTGDAASAAPALANATGAGVDCPIVASLREALERDPMARAALARIPRPSRSVANAVMLWDGRWIAPDRVGGIATVDAVRNAVAAILNRASQACRTQTVLGPVFVPVAGDGGTIVLALGSGAWRWADMLRESTVGDIGEHPNDRRRN